MEDLIHRVRDVLNRGDERPMEIREEILERFECPQCLNSDPRYFRKERGDIICLGANEVGCGTVVREHYTTEGDDLRTFADDDKTKDRVHRGSAPNRFLSASSNMATRLRTAPGADGRLARVARKVELQHNANERENTRMTRQSTKDEMKIAVWRQMDFVGDMMSLPRRALQGAKQRFAVYRDKMEHVNAKEAVVVACLLDAMWEYQVNEGRTLRLFKCKYCGLEFSVKRSVQDHDCPMRPAAKPEAKDVAVPTTDAPRWDTAQCVSWATGLAVQLGLRTAEVEQALGRLRDGLEGALARESKAKESRAAAAAQSLFISSSRGDRAKGGAAKTAGQVLLEVGVRKPLLAQLMNVRVSSTAAEKELVNALHAKLVDLANRASVHARRAEELEKQKRRVNLETVREEALRAKKLKLEGIAAGNGAASR